MALTAGDFPTDHHGWSELLPPRIATDSISGKHTTPWAVIGAGVTGLACARRLAELHPDDEILLLDARLVGQGASGRNSGFAVTTTRADGIYDPKQKPNYLRINRINQAGIALLRQQVDTHAIDCQWHEDGYYYPAADKMAIQEGKNCQHFLEQLEIPHTVYDRDQLVALLGTPHYQTGIHIPGGVLLQPAALVRGLADNLPGNVRLIEQCPVLKVENGSSVKLHLATGEIHATKVILATNYEAAKLGFLGNRLLGGTLSGSFTRILSDEEMASLGSLNEWGILSLHGGGATIRLTKDRRICIRNTSEYNHGRLFKDSQLAQRRTVHRDAFERRFPQLADVPFEYSWSCVEGISRNFTNFFGRQSENIYFAGGYNGSGVTRGTAFGHALAEYASSGQSDLINDCLASPKAQWIPPSPLRDIGALFTVRSKFKGVGADR